LPRLPTVGPASIGRTQLIDRATLLEDATSAFDERRFRSPASLGKRQLVAIAPQQIASIVVHAASTLPRGVQ
jgi:hypothetical protein